MIRTYDQTRNSASAFLSARITEISVVHRNSISALIALHVRMYVAARLGMAVLPMMTDQHQAEESIPSFRAGLLSEGIKG